MKNKTRKLSKADITYTAIIYAFLGLFILAVAYPLIYILSCSFSSPAALVSGKVFLFPVDFGFKGYETIFSIGQVWVGYKNTIIYTVIFTVLSVFFTLLVAFPLTRSEFPARKIVIWLFTITMFINGGMIPTYILVSKLGLIDSMWALILPGLVSAWNVIISRTFIKSTIPQELFEANSIDGGDYFQFFFKIVLPLSKPVIAVLALISATNMWNSYFSALLYINDAAKYPLQIILRNILIQNIVDYTAIEKISVDDMMQQRYLSELLKYSLIVVSSIPLLIFYPFIQKYFIKGMMVGSIKG